MGLFLTTSAGLVVWIVLWAIGVKPFDAFLLTLGMIIVAATLRMIRRTFRATARTPTSPPERAATPHRPVGRVCLCSGAHPRIPAANPSHPMRRVS